MVRTPKEFNNSNLEKARATLQTKIEASATSEELQQLKAELEELKKMLLNNAGVK